MKAREAINLSLHIVVAVAMVLAACWSYWMLIPDTFIWAWLREQAQHRWILTYLGNQTYTVEKSTFFGWMTWHRMFEVLQWTIGATIGCVAWHFMGGM